MKFQITLLTLCLPLSLTTKTALEEFTSGNNLFTSEVYTELVKKQSGNFLVSPLSVETILALTQSGAKDATGEELRTVLHLPKSQELIESAIKSFHGASCVNQSFVLNSANKIYLKSGTEIHESFKKIATEAFGSELETIEFKKNVEAASTINQWVEERTEHKIKDLISSQDLSESTKVVLINALYFKGNWSNPFKATETYSVDFFQNEKTVLVDMMHDTSSWNYHESTELDAKFLELPFQGGEATLTIVLPNNKTGLSELEKSVNKVVQKPQFENVLVNVAIPKFKIETQIDFKAILQELGVKKLFNEEADLSALAGKKGDILVDKVVQKTFVDVNEEGVEAAAATVVVTVESFNGFPDEVPTKEFTADHPFIFYIKVKDLVVFAGRVVDPSS